MSFFLELRPLSFGQSSGSRSTASNSQLLRPTQSFSTANGKKGSWRCVMSPASLRLIGNVSDICRPVYSSDNQEQVTVSVEGAEPLYAAHRIPHKQGWRHGQKGVVVIAPVSADDGWDSSS